MIDTNASLGDIAASGADARVLLLRHQLDFCCGGQRSLADACASSGLQASEVVREIEAARDGSGPAIDWRDRPSVELVDHILERYHAPLPAHLEAVISAAEKVERVHAAKASCPTGLAAHLHRVRAELTSHMAKEEQVLFPAIRAGRRGLMLSGPIRVMEHEHEEHGGNLARLRALAHDFEPPDEACATWRTLYEELARLERDLMAHIHLENHLLFPRVLEEVTPEAS